MAVYTILENAAKENRSTVVIEFDVPTGSNSANVPWRTVVAEVRTEDGTVNPRKQADTPHAVLLDAGEIVEITLTVEYDAGLSDAGKVAVLDAAVAEKVAEFTSEFAALYAFYGTVRTVGGS